MVPSVHPWARFHACLRQGCLLLLINVFHYEPYARFTSVFLLWTWALLRFFRSPLVPGLLASWEACCASWFSCLGFLLTSRQALVRDWILCIGFHFKVATGSLSKTAGVSRQVCGVPACVACSVGFGCFVDGCFALRSRSQASGSHMLQRVRQCPS